MLIKKSTSPEETMELGEVVGKLLVPGDLVNLNGDLGAGKTLFVKGVARGLGVAPSVVTSPTFSIINEYQGDGSLLYHFDLYRLEDELDLEQVGYLDYFYGSGITVVEWGNRFSHHLPEQRLDIDLDSAAPQERQIIFTGQGHRGRLLAEQLRGLV